jgi:hypothetical protein
MCGLGESMQLETKFLRLRTPVTIGSRFGDWEVCWLGGWTRHRLRYLVMVVRACDSQRKRLTTTACTTQRRGRNR